MAAALETEARDDLEPPSSASTGKSDDEKDGRTANGDPSRMSRRLLGSMAVMGLVLLGQPPWSFADDPFHALDLIRLSPPALARDFTVPGLDARPLSLSDFKGKVRILNFWATWCPPCKEEMPSMERLYRRYRDRGFTIIGISIDKNVPAVGPFVRRLGLTFPIGLDPKSAVANDYTVRALPSSFLIDRESKIVAIALGSRDWDTKAARLVTEALLK